MSVLMYKCKQGKKRKQINMKINYTNFQEESSNLPETAKICYNKFTIRESKF